MPITIGYIPIACATSLILADALGTFAAGGLNVRLRKFVGWSELWSAYVTGDIDVAHMLSPMPIAIDAGAAGGARPTRIAATLNTNGQAFVLAAHHHARVRDISDLRGFTLGIPFEYSVHALLLRDQLAAAGVDPDLDVSLRLLRPADMVAQLATGTIDGFVGPEPLTERALQQGYGRAFALTKQWWDNHPCCCVAVAKDFADAHPGIDDALQQSLFAAARTTNDAARTAEIAAQENYLNQPAAFVAGALSGTYTAWDDRVVTDLERMRFDSPTDGAAVTWMAAQLARWNLGIPATTAAVTAAAEAVLPAGTPTSPALEISGTTFRPTAPLAGYGTGPN
ncbi:ABC transporter substrate-binding protein [Corynebacterium sp. 13CS0277]|uniref:ABC transporter substrate-binding protein n=1 Tax=Corynebacterium sp. 13CS0277 TaxID=2071994 RepID=UPI001E2945AE|nr:ABC transporter substrate-binding protein [Corynebacterium sp. 13CS0277]